MGLHLVHFEKENIKRWGVVEGGKIKVLQQSYATLSQFLAEGINEAKSVAEGEATEVVSVDEVTFLSPVTQPARIICQGANYSTHREESGLESERPPFNLIFGKADSTLTGAYSDIVRPSHVKLLDYEIELGLVLGKDIDGEVEVTEDNLHEYVAGIVLANDVSARDVQLVEGQWLKGKSYRTFCPTGPYLYLFDEDELDLINDLEINLWVNDELRQSASTKQLLFKPTETLTELSQIMDLSIGDLVLTGTTGGVAMNLSPDMLKKITDLTFPADEKRTVFIEDQLKEGNKYLNDGDVIRASIRSKDGKIDLGEQKNSIVSQEKVKN